MTNQLYIANLGKYNEGELVGSWFSFPIDMEEVAAEIGLNAQYEEWAIHDCEFDFPMRNIGEYENIENLNNFIEAIENNESLVELFEVLKTEKYNTDAIACVAMSAFSELEIDHDIISDETIDEMVKQIIEDDGGFVRVKYFLSDASNTNEYHMLDGYGNVERLTVEYIENVLNDYLNELKREYNL